MKHIKARPLGRGAHQVEGDKGGGVSGIYKWVIIHSLNSHSASEWAKWATHCYSFVIKKGGWQNAAG